MLEFFGLATQMRRQGFPVVLGKNPRRVAVDELVQISRVSVDGDRSHPQVTTALREQFEDSAAHRVKIFVRVIRLQSHI